MSLFYSIIPLLLIMVPLLIKKVSLKKIMNGIFWGIISVIISGIFASLLAAIFFKSTSIELLTRDASILTFIVTLIIAAIPEELCKFISIKWAKSNIKFNIFINSMLVSAIFTSIENYLHYTQNGIYLSITRLLHPGHMFFGLFMAFF